MPQIRNYAARVVDMTPAGMARLLRTDRATRLLRPLVNQVLPHQATRITVRAGVGQGLRLRILPQTEKYYWTGLHELHVQEALQRELRPGAVFWDVGAHSASPASSPAALSVPPAGSRPSSPSHRMSSDWPAPSA